MSHAGGEPSVYSVSNLIRKLRLEDTGTAIKPTPARAQVPAEYQDGLRSAAEHELRAVGRRRQAVNSDEAFAEPASQHCRREQNKVRQKVIFNLEIFISEVKPSFTLITVS